jgi:hypothetical protein
MKAGCTRQHGGCVLGNRAQAILGSISISPFGMSLHTHEIRVSEFSPESYFYQFGRDPGSVTVQNHESVPVQRGAADLILRGLREGGDLGCSGPIVKGDYA